MSNSSDIPKNDDPSRVQKGVGTESALPTIFNKQDNLMVAGLMQIEKEPSSNYQKRLLAISITIVII